MPEEDKDILNELVAEHLAEFKHDVQQTSKAIAQDMIDLLKDYNKGLFDKGVLDDSIKVVEIRLRMEGYRQEAKIIRSIRKVATLFMNRYLGIDIEDF